MVNDEGCFRVEGVLGVSRAIGDHYLKPYVAYTPDVYDLHRTDDDLFLVLARSRLIIDSKHVMSSYVREALSCGCLTWYFAFSP